MVTNKGGNPNSNQYWLLFWSVGNEFTRRLEKIVTAHFCAKSCSLLKLLFMGLFVTRGSEQSFVHGNDISVLGTRIHHGSSTSKPPSSGTTGYAPTRSTRSPPREHIEASRSQANRTLSSEMPTTTSSARFTTCVRTMPRRYFEGTGRCLVWSLAPRCI